MKRIGIVMVRCVVASSAYGVECRSKPDTGKGHQTWRQIDGKRCWYTGRRALPRASLHWPRSVEPKRFQAPPPRADLPTLSTTSTEVASAGKSVWDCCGLPPAPLLPLPVEPFADRWNETQSRLLRSNGERRQ